MTDIYLDMSVERRASERVDVTDSERFDEQPDAETLELGIRIKGLSHKNTITVLEESSW